MIFSIWNQALSKLCDIRLGTTSVRPICNLVCKSIKDSIK